METARIEIVRFLTDEGDDVVNVTAADPDGDSLPLIESLGMLELARDTLLHLAMDDDPEDES